MRPFSHGQGYQGIAEKGHLWMGASSVPANPLTVKDFVLKGPSAGLSECVEFPFVFFPFWRILSLTD
jgi:hypothetical protein